jgi:hypothetical protein
MTASAEMNIRWNRVQLGASSARRRVGRAAACPTLCSESGGPARRSALGLRMAGVWMRLNTFTAMLSAIRRLLYVDARDRS